MSEPGLPDGIFFISKPNSFGICIYEGLGVENVDIFMTI
jgi:hypothetical protein